MTALRAGEVTSFQTTQEYHYHDACKIHAYSGTDDAYNIPQATYTEGSEIACGFEMVGTDERVNEADVPVVDGKLRLPVGTTLTPNDRIEITKRYGVAITPLFFEVVGLPLRGSSGLVVELAKVTDGQS